MPYINERGEIVSTAPRPTTIQAVHKKSVGFLDMIVLFFRTLVDPNAEQEYTNVRYQADRATPRRDNGRGHSLRSLNGNGGGSMPPMMGGG
ncbi:MAG: hypothetical protein MHM6MM_008126 [Cercozoa sp. M6MM]